MQCVIAVLLVFAIWPALLLNAQVPQYLRLELLRTQLLGRDFERPERVPCVEATRALQVSQLQYPTQ
jgi:hypothetical protein